MSATAARSHRYRSRRCLSGWVVLAMLAMRPATGQERAADSAALPAPRLPTPELLADWVPPSWWRPLQAVAGDLDRDGLDDLVVLMQRRDAAPEDPTHARGARALQVLFGVPGGGYRRGPLLPNLLPCADCLSSLAGMIESAVFDLQISGDGVLEIGWVHRRHGIQAVRLSIGWHPDAEQLALLADDVAIIAPRGGARSRIRRDYIAGEQWVDGVAQPLEPRVIPIESVSAAGY